MAYLGNRPRRQGVMEKCHFCIQRTRAGRYPGVPGSLSRRRAQVRQHPRSEQRSLLHPARTKRVFIQLKEEMGTSPRFFYYFDV